MIELTWDGKKIPVKELEFTIDEAMDMPEVPDIAPLKNAISGSMTVTLDPTFYRAMMLARLLDKHSPKKAKKIRRMVERHNPLHMLGLI